MQNDRFMLHLHNDAQASIRNPRTFPEISKELTFTQFRLGGGSSSRGPIVFSLPRPRLLPHRAARRYLTFARAGYELSRHARRPSPTMHPASFRLSPPQTGSETVIELHRLGTNRLSFDH